MIVQDLTKITALRAAALKLAEELEELIARHSGIEALPDHLIQMQSGRVRAACKELVERGHPIFHVLTGAE